MNKLVIANWKTYLKSNEALELAYKLNSIENLIIAASTPHLGLIKHNIPSLNLASQDISAISHEYGTNTGEIPAKMLFDMGVRYSIIGHSERRVNNLEDNSTITIKTQNALSENITPIICVGESIDDRESGKYKEVIRNQLLSLKLNKECRVIIAYEPLWSVGTGIVPSLGEIEEIMILIKSTLEIAEKLILVYGGSVNSQNAKRISSISSVDGLLIGKASTELDHINEIIRQIC